VVTVGGGLRLLTPEQARTESEAITELEERYGLTVQVLGCVLPQGIYYVSYYRTMSEEVERRFGPNLVDRVIDRHLKRIETEKAAGHAVKTAS